MNKRKMTTKELDFCRHYVRLRNPKEAALHSGFTLLPEYRGVVLLSRKEIREKIKELENECPATSNLVSAGLQRLAFGSVGDAVRLILSSKNDSFPDIDSLDLFNVSEIKFTSGKGMEIKFFDRLKALERLAEISCDDRDNGAFSFYEAIERSAAGQTESENDD